MVLAERVAVNRALDDLAEQTVRSASAFGWEGGEQVGFALVPGRRVEECAQEALRRPVGSRRVQVHTELLEDLGDVALEGGPLGRVDGPGGDVIPGEGLVRIPQQRGQDALARRLLAQPVRGGPVSPCGVAVVAHACAPSPVCGGPRFGWWSQGRMDASLAASVRGARSNTTQHLPGSRCSKASTPLICSPEARPRMSARFAWHTRSMYSPATGLKGQLPRT